MSRAYTEELVRIAQAARATKHGEKEAIYSEAIERLGISRAKLLRDLKEIDIGRNRKKRTDTGQSALTREEALMISAILKESTRGNGKRLLSIGDAVEILRANDQIQAGAVDTATGEMIQLSDSAIGRALGGYQLHPSQVNQPAPVTEMATEHPNHCWQIDASLCVLYYLRTSVDDRQNGLRVAPREEFYKNKPGNLKKIESERVWRYAVTDHTSGAGYVEYVLGAESGENLAHIFINAIQHRGEHDPMHGVPRIAMLDPGSANTGAIFKNLCKALNIQLQINQVGNPRAKGQVENYHNLIERKFECGLRFFPIKTLDQLNELAWRWMRHFNATAEHSRHGKTRNEVWNEITERQLLKAPDIKTCRELARTAPEERTVNPNMTVSYKGPHYDVSDVPGLIVNQKVWVCLNPWRKDSAQVVLIGLDGKEEYHVVECVECDGYGFRTDAVIIGERYRAPKDTQAQKDAKTIEKLVTGAETLKDAQKLRKGKVVPFNGKIDPQKHMREDLLPSYLQKRGTATPLEKIKVEMPKLTLTELMVRLSAHMGKQWTPDYYPHVRAWHPEGATEAEIPELAERLLRADKHREAVKLSVVK